MWLETHRCWVRMKTDKAKLRADMPSCSKHRSWSRLCLVHYSTAILLTHCEENILAWHIDHYDLRPNVVSTLLSSTTKNSSLFLHEGCQKKRQPWDSSIWDAHFTQCKPDFHGHDQGIARLKQISACTLGTSDIIHSGAVETLFLMLSCLSDIPRPHLKWTRHDKKKQRGKSRQRTSGADGATYVELSVHNNVCL